MATSLLYDCAEELMGSGEYDSLFLVGTNFELESAEVAMDGNIPQLLLMIGDMLWHFEKRSGMNNKDIAEFISLAYEMRCKVDAKEDVSELQQRFRDKIGEVFSNAGE